jgi:S1-C subfamily serine protease
MKTLVIAGEKLPKSIPAFLLIAILLLTGLGNSCSFVQYSDNARKVLPAAVRITAGDSLGSGVVVGKAGLVLTSNHVVAGSKIAEVFFINGTRYPGRLLLTDADKDLALIQLEGSGVQFPCASLGSSVESDGLQTGDNLEIIGYPAFTGSDGPVVTSGRISGFPRIESVQFIQTCAPVYPGNSGGPVINRFGEVIGIVNGKYTNASDRCATFATAISEADSMIAEADGRARDHDSINGPVITQTICPNVSCRAPDFTLSSTEGKQYTLQSIKGKKSILIFTGENYSSIPRSLECLTKLYGLWPRGQLEVIMVVKQKSNGGAADWVKANGIKFPVLEDVNGEMAGLYGAGAFPAFYFLNAYGEIKIKRAAAVDLCYEEIDTLLRLY